MEKEKEQHKKCFCARCFLPIDEEDKVDIEGQNFHRMCSTCCVCRTIPKSIKMFYGHVFCEDCFKAHVLRQFRGEAPRMQSCSWWSQWAPGMRPMDETCHKEDCKTCGSTEEPGKKYICSRCLQAVDEKAKVDIGGQHFHPQCAKCYFCHCVPTSNLKIYYGQVFCEDCFNRHVLSRNRDNPSEFFKTCFEQWQNVQFAEGMRQFMGCNKEGSNQPFVFCRCSGASEWGPQPDARKSVTAKNQSPTILEDESLEDLYFENRTEMSDIPESCTVAEGTEAEENGAAAEKIEKLTKYLHEEPSSRKKWKNFVEFDKVSVTTCGWVDLQDERVPAQFECPKCLWQCGPIFVSREVLRKCGNVLQ